MPKVITFSQTFPVKHPDAGKPTRFVEKIWAHLSYEYDGEWLTNLSYKHEGFLWHIKNPYALKKSIKKPSNV